jgi:hypothetical protein
MAETNAGSRSKPGYVVLREVADGQWRLIGEADRRPGQTARKARIDAVLEATGGAREPDERYVVVLRSEWRLGFDC